MFYTLRAVAVVLITAMLFIVTSHSVARAQTAAEFNAINRHVSQLAREGKYSEATPIAQQALALAEGVLGNEHPETLNAVNNLATLYYTQGGYGEAEVLYSVSLPFTVRRRGDQRSTADGVSFSPVSSKSSHTRRSRILMSKSTRLYMPMLPIGVRHAPTRAQKSTSLGAWHSSWLSYASWRSGRGTGRMRSQIIPAKATMSSANSAVCSSIGKWPPLGCPRHSLMFVRERSAKRRGVRGSSGSA